MTLITAANGNLSAARGAKKDEFYTQLVDIEKELSHYRKHFAGKVVYLNCDDPRVSNFFRYFSENFEALGLKRLIATCYQSEDPGQFSRGDSSRAVWLEYDGDKNGNRVPDANEIGVRPLKGDGDFRSAESVELLRQADIVVTNRVGSGQPISDWSSTAVQSVCADYYFPYRRDEPAWPGDGRSHALTDLDDSARRTQLSCSAFAGPGPYPFKRFEPPDMPTRLWHRGRRA